MKVIDQETEREIETGNREKNKLTIVGFLLIKTQKINLFAVCANAKKAVDRSDSGKFAVILRVGFGFSSFYQKYICGKRGGLGRDRVKAESDEWGLG